VEGYRLGSCFRSEDAQHPFDDLAGHIALFLDFFAEQFLKNVGVRRSPAYEEVTVFLGMLNFGQGRHTLADQPFRFRRGQGK
jgi:hypothetical protein